MKPSRRQFTIMGTGALLGAIHGGPAFADMLIEGDAAPVSGKPWYYRIKRIGQTNFNEKDPVDGNVEEWANYWASAKVNAVALSVSGPVAFYPTDVPFYRRSPYLNGRDLFGECVKAAAARGIRVYGRMSPDVQWTDTKTLAANPLWFRRTREGALQESAPGLAFTCQFGGNFSELQPAILRELMSRYDIDGVYMNGWPTVQVCYCANCRKIGDPHSAEYKAALTASAIELIETYKKIIRAKRADNFYSCNLGGGIRESGLNQWQLTRTALWYTADNQSREGVVAPVWQDAQQVKFARCLMGDRPVTAVTASYARSGRIMWRNVTEYPGEVECRMAQTAAAGGIVWYHWLGLEQGFSEDRRWQDVGRDFLSWHAANDIHFQNVRSMSKLAVIASTKSVTLYDAPSAEEKTDYLQGIYAVLTEARIAFDYVHENDLSLDRLAPYSAIILPNVALLSDAQCDVLRAYADRGGSLLATFETGLYDENGKARSDFALGDLFGIHKTGPRERAQDQPAQPILSIHLQKIFERNAITAGFENTTWIAGPVWRIPLAPVNNPIMTYIKPYPAYPTEAVYEREPPTNLPTVVLREKGRSRLAYLAGDMDATYWRLDNRDLGRELLNTIQWVLGDTNALTVEGEGLMEVFAWQTEAGFAVHMVNYNGPNAYRGKMRKPLTLGPQNITLVVPQGVTIRSASARHSGATLVFQQAGRVVKVTAPSVGFYEVVALEV